MIYWEEVWSRETARFGVVLEVAPETDDPAEHFARDDGRRLRQDIKFCREGGWHWFQARVRVIFYAHPENREDGGIELGADYLGACSYLNRDDFTKRRGDYFHDMVNEAIAQARHMSAGLRLRAA